MHLRVTYIHHNCFLLELPGLNLLFDFPSREHLPPAAKRAALRAVEGLDIVLVVSHSHADHFDPHITTALEPSSSLRFVVSDDVAEMYPDALPADAEILEPDEEYPDVWGMRFETLMSNDLGCAWIIGYEGLRIWYGGDLANWNWPGQEPAANRFTENFFAQALERAGAEQVHLAFQNVDERLDSLAGGPQFMERVRPGLFVPMHGFGRPAGIFAALPEPPSGVRIFHYERPGDAVEADLGPDAPASMG
jgi:L-ascorbate metabolism protein UlaG (beta-lactamase superfamily)